jgi:hypothetical protein
VVDLTIATAGTGTLALVAAGALSSGTGSIVGQALDGKKINWIEVGVSTVLGAGLGYLGSKIAPLIVGSGRVNSTLVVGDVEVVTEASANSVSTNVVQNQIVINKGVLQKFAEHGFRGNRHSNLGLQIDEMAAKGYDLVKQNLSKLQNGDNTLSAVINGIEKTFRVNVENGTVRSINMFDGPSPRVLGVKIDLGQISW